MPSVAFLLAAALLLAAPAWAEPPGKAVLNGFFVAPDGRDSWSGRLPRPAADGIDGPFATPSAARDAMRREAGRKQAGGREPGGRTTYLRAGTYDLAIPLRLGAEDTGVSFLAYPGEHPLLRGGQSVRGWHHGADDWTAPLPLPLAEGDGLPLLLGPEGALPVSRLPPAGPGEDREAAWLFADATPAGIDPQRAFRVRAADAAALAAALPGTVATVFGARGWQDYVLPVRDTDPARRVVSLAGGTWDEIGAGSRFALLNTQPTPGTWRLDPATRQLHWGGPPPPAALAATLPCIVVADGARDVTLAGLHLAGSASEGAAVCLSRTQRVTLDGLTVTDTGDGIRLDHATDTRITGGEIARTGGSGIVLRHGSDGTVVQGAWLHDIGWLHQDASAIFFNDSSRNLFARNRIENVAKFAIGGGSDTEGGAYDNTIEGNEIVRSNQRTSDGGAIMVIGWAQDMTRDVVRDNFVSATGALGNTGWDGLPHRTFQDPVTRLVSNALYFDDWASGVAVTGNLVCGNIGGIALHGGWDNHVSGNMLIGNAGIALNIDAIVWLGTGAHPHAMEGNVVEHNTVVLREPSAGQSGITAERGPDAAAHFDHNVYLGPGLNGYSFHHERDHPWSDYSFGIAAWRARGQDTASDVGAPLARVAVEDGAVRVLGIADGPPPLPLASIGRPEDAAGLAERVRERCGVP